MAEEPDLLISAGFSDAQLVREANKIVDLYKKKGAEAEKAFVDAQGKVTNTKAVEAHKRELNRLSKAYDPAYRAAKQYEAELKKLDRALDIGAISQKQYTAQVEQAAAALQRVNQPMVAAAQGGKRLGGSFQQVGYQVGDFAVQVGAGTSAAQALGQQLPQLLGAFGAFGALAGAAAAIAIPLGTALFKMGDEAETAEDRIKELSKATDAYVDAAARASTPIDELRKKYGSLADEIHRVSGLQASIAGAVAQNSLDNVVSSVAKSFGPADLLRQQAAGRFYGPAGTVITKNIDELAEKFGVTRKKALELIDELEGLENAAGAEAQVKALQTLLEEMVRLAGGADALAKKVPEVYEEISAALKQAGKQVEASASDQVKAQQRVLEEYTTTTETLKKLMADRIAAQQLLDAAVAKGGKEFIQIAKERLAAVNAEISKTNELSRANDKALQKTLSVLQAREDAATVRQESFDAVRGSAIELIKEFEGRLEKPKWDVNAYRAGFGSDTITHEDGSYEKITKDTFVSLEAANRDLARRIGEFQRDIVGDIGLNRFDSFTQEQQAALTSIAYNYGSLPDRIIEAVRSGTEADIANAIGGLAGDNDGINSDRRFKEASAFGSASISKSAYQDQVEAIQEEEKALADQIKKRERLAEQVKKYGEQLQQNLLTAQQQTELERQRNEQIAAIKAQDLTPEAEADAIAAVNAELEKQATILKLVEEAKRRGVDLNERMAGSTVTYKEAIAALGEVQRQQILNQHEVTQAQDEANQAQEFFKQQQQELQQGIVSAIVNGENFADVLSNIAKKFAEAALQAALFGNGPLSGGGASLGGIFGSIGKFLGFADGGYTGSGGKHQPAGIVHGGEYVMDAETVRRAGGPAAFDAMRRGLKGYADGGYVMPSIPQPIMPSMSEVGQQAPKIIINNNAPGVDVQADYATKDEVRITVAKAIAGNNRRQADSQYLNGRR